MNATGKHRLLKLADFLETEVEPALFSAFRLAQKIEDGKPKCGTIACALGWATAIPSFRRAGLYLSDSTSLRIKRQRHRKFRTGYSEAAAIFFDLEKDTASALFDEGKGTGRKGIARVVRDIRKLVASEQKRAA